MNSLVRLFRRNGVRVTVSRSMLYRSASLLAAGAYFVVLGAAVEGSRYFNVPLDDRLVVPLACAAGTALAIALLSDRIRRRCKVFVTKHFFAHKHDYRRTWLDLSERLAACATRTELEQAIPAAYCEVFGTGNAALFVRAGESGRCLSAEGAASRPPFQPSPALLEYFTVKNRVWNPRDGEYAADAQESAFVRDACAHLIVPLMSGDRLEGVVLLGPALAGERFTFEDYDLMKLIARQSALLLCNQRLSRELVETRELAAVARVASFVVHDLKNQAQTLSLLVNNAEGHFGNEEFQQDMLSAVRHTLADMKGLIQKLKVRPGRVQARRLCTDARVLCDTVVREFAATRTRAFLVCKGEPFSCAADPDELRTVVVNLVQNAVDAAGEAGTISVETGREGPAGRIRICDNGCGMTADFMEKQLFRPFRSTKKNGLGIGLYQCRQIVDSLGGSIAVSSAAGKGTTFTIILPAVKGLTAPEGERGPESAAAEGTTECARPDDVDAHGAQLQRQGKRRMERWTDC